MEPPFIDLRSDTVTRPTPGMRAAMAAAEVGDDVYGEDPTVTALQERVAAMFGHEAALWTPTGSMANQICLQLSVSPGEELLCDADAHVVTYEIGAAAAVGGISSRTWPAVGADIDVEAVAEMIRPDGYGAVVTKAMAVEQTHNRAGGQVISLSTLQGLRKVADAAGIALHCDGARIWHAHVADGVPLATYGALFDTMSVCLSKGLGAPAGSLIIGSAEAIERARLIRKRMGGGLRQVGIIAAAGDYALSHHLSRLAADHDKAGRLAQALAATGFVDPDRVRTNIVPVDLAGAALDAPAFAAAAQERGVLVSTMGPRLARLVTHLDASADAIDRAGPILAGLLSR
jgi:threonine aldolase